MKNRIQRFLGDKFFSKTIHLSKTERLNFLPYFWIQIIFFEKSKYEFWLVAKKLMNFFLGKVYTNSVKKQPGVHSCFYLFFQQLLSIDYLLFG